MKTNEPGVWRGRWDILRWYRRNGTGFIRGSMTKTFIRGGMGWSGFSGG
jgi:hypothetical protein